MKAMKIVLIAVITIFMNVNIHAQEKKIQNGASLKTQSFKVEGNCNQCKARIESAAKIEGVSKAEWNKDSKMLTLVYNPLKITSDDVLKKIAAAGHDNEKFKAADKSYNSLPDCCKYRESSK
jgi:periplasmic mercuric ion binding protein